MQNSDVPRLAAQEASCLQASDFEKTYYTVDAAICGNRKTRRKASDQYSGRITYEQLIEKYKLPIGPPRLLPCFVKAERAIATHHDYSPSFDDDHLKLMVFYYVCKILKVRPVFP